MSDRLPSIHPGEVLKEDFLVPMGISQYRLAKDTGVSQMTISKIVRGQQSISADVALRLGLFFGISPQTWLNLQSSYDLEKARLALSDRLSDEVHPLAA